MGTIYPGAPGATGRQARARSLAEHATSNTTEEANDRCRTPDDSTAEDEHSDHNRTTPATRQAPAWAPFTFQGLSWQLSHAAHGRFVKARPARPTSTRLRSRRARQSPSGGSIVAQTKTHTGSRRRIARNDWRNHGTHSRMRRARGKPRSGRMDDGDRDAGVHEGEPKQGVRPHLVGRDRLVQVRKEAPGFEGVRGRLHRIEERQEMTAATAPGAARGRAREGASRRKDIRHALVDGVTAPLDQVRTDKGKLRVAIASQLRRTILVFRNLEEAANLFQGHYQQQFHPVPLLHSLPAHAIRLLVAH